MGRFLVRLGNTEVRPGHRVGCAQVAVTFTVEAQDKQGAVDLVRAMTRKTVHLHFAPPISGNPSATVSVDVATDRVRLADVVEL